MSAGSFLFFSKVLTPKITPENLIESMEKGSITHDEAYAAIESWIKNDEFDPNQLLPPKMETLLTWAAANEDLVLVDLLLSNMKTNVNKTNEAGGSPLVYAAQTDSSKIAQLLMEKKADPNTRLVNGMTPFATAVKKGHLATVEMMQNFISAGYTTCIQEQKTIKSSEPIEIPVIFFALDSPYPAYLSKFLLEHHSSSDEKDSTGLTFKNAAQLKENKNVLEVIKYSKGVKSKLEKNELISNAKLYAEAMKYKPNLNNIGFTLIKFLKDAIKYQQDKGEKEISHHRATLTSGLQGYITQIEQIDTLDGLNIFVETCQSGISHLKKHTVIDQLLIVFNAAQGAIKSAQATMESAKENEEKTKTATVKPPGSVSS